MAGDSNVQLKKNIDKVSYGVAGVLALVLLALPFLLGGSVKKLTEGVNAKTDDLDAKKKKAQNQQVPGVGFTSADLESLWNIRGDDSRPTWFTAPRPAVVRRFSEKPAKDAVHGAPCIVSIELVRDVSLRRPTLRVTGKMSSANAWVDIDSVALSRRVGAGEFEEVPGFAEAGDFVYEDRDVQAGEVYAYRVISHAVPQVVDDKTAILPAGDEVKTSNELATPAPLPHDLAIQISAFSNPSVDVVQWFSGTVYYWNYQTGKKERAPRPAPGVPGMGRDYEFGEAVEGGARYRVLRVRPEDEEVQVEDRLLRSKEPFKRDKTQGQRETEGWSPVTQDCEPASTGAAAATPAVEPGGAASGGARAGAASPTVDGGAPLPPPPDGGATSGAARRRGGRGFGD